MIGEVFAGYPARVGKLPIRPSYGIISEPPRCIVHDMKSGVAAVPVHDDKAEGQRPAVDLVGLAYPESPEGQIAGTGEVEVFGLFYLDLPQP